MYDIVTIGDSTIDMFLEIDEATLDCDIKTKECQLCFTYADKIPIAGAHQSVGGNAANVAVGAQKLGLSAAIATELGDDLNGMIIQEELEKSGVTTKYVRVNKGQETRYAVVLNYRGERTILSYHAKRTYKPVALPKTKAIYYTSLGKSSDKIQKTVIAYKKKNPQTLLAFNPGSYQMKEGIAHTRALLKFTDILFVNKEEAQKITDTKQEVPALIQTLHHSGVKTVIVTDGSHGSYVSHGNILYHMPRFSVKTVSRTGAGDAYASACISALILGHSIEEAICWGTANASSVVQKFGGQSGLLTPKQITSVLKKYSSIKPKLVV